MGKDSVVLVKDFAPLCLNRYEHKGPWGKAGMIRNHSIRFIDRTTRTEIVKSCDLLPKYGEYFVTGISHEFSSSRQYDDSITVVYINKSNHVEEMYGR